MTMHLFATVALTLILSGTAFAGVDPPPVSVPEPGTTLLLLGGLGAAWWGARRRRK